MENSQILKNLPKRALLASKLPLCLYLMAKHALLKCMKEAKDKLYSQMNHFNFHTLIKLLRAEFLGLKDLIITWATWMTTIHHCFGSLQLLCLYALYALWQAMLFCKSILVEIELLLNSSLALGELDFSLLDYAWVVDIDQSPD